jgi:hypothetical protein
VVGGLEIGVDHRSPGREAVEAGSLVVLQLEELEGPAAVVGRGHVLQPPVVVGQQQSDRGRTADRRGVVGELVQELDEVEVGDEGVGHLDEHVGEPFGGDHRDSSFLDLRVAGISLACHR